MKDLHKTAVLALILLSLWGSTAFVLLEQAEEDCVCHFCEEGTLDNAEACEYYCSDCDRFEYGIGNDFTLLDTLEDGSGGSSVARSNSYKKWDATPFDIKEWPGSLKSVTILLSQQNSGQTSNIMLALYSSALGNSAPQNWVAHLGTKAVTGSSYTQTTFTPTSPVPLEKNTRYWVAVGRLNGNNHGLKHTSKIPTDHPCFVEYSSIFLSSPDQATPFDSEGKNIVWSGSSKKTNTGLMMKIIAVTTAPADPPDEPSGPTYSDVTLYSNLGSGGNTNPISTNPYKKWDGNYFDTTSDCPEGFFKSLTLELLGPSSGSPSTVVAALWKSAKTSTKPTDFVGKIGTASLPSGSSAYPATTFTATEELEILPDTRYWWVLARTAGNKHGIRRTGSSWVQDHPSYVADVSSNLAYTSGDQASIDANGETISFSTWATTGSSKAYRFQVVGSMLDED